MKNRRLILSVSTIILFLVGAFIKETLFADSLQSKNDNQTSLPVVGVLQFVSHPSLDEIYQGMVDELAKSGYKNGETVTLERQNGQADQSKLASMSQQLISKNPNVLVAIATPAAQALANQTQDIPLILGAVSDPVGSGLAESMEKPGKNATGVSDIAPVDEQLDLIQTLLPGKKVMGILTSSSEDNSKFHVDRTTKIAEAQGFTVKSYTVPSSNEITQMIHSLATDVDFLYIPNDNTIANAMPTVVSVADQYQLPVIPAVEEMVAQGGLATVGNNQKKLGQQIGKMVVKVLEDELDPAKTPIEVFSTGDPVISPTKATELGITIPKELENIKTIQKDVK